MTDGVLSGKTGFTGDAGYCYVCACEKMKRLLWCPFWDVAGQTTKDISGRIL